MSNALNELKDILSGATPSAGLTQFTIDWAEVCHDSIIEMEEGKFMTTDENVFMGALAYDTDNILTIMRPDLCDVLFFERVNKLTSNNFDVAKIP